VYIFEWKQHFCNGQLVCAHPLVLREPSRLHAREVVLLLWKKHYILVSNFHAFKGGNSETTLRTTRCNIQSALLPPVRVALQGR